MRLWVDLVAVVVGFSGSEIVGRFSGSEIVGGFSGSI